MGLFKNKSNQDKMPRKLTPEEAERNLAKLPKARPGGSQEVLGKPLAKLGVLGRTVITVTPDLKIRGQGKVISLAGAQARVESEGELTSRVTMTRLVGLGIFAFGAKKKVDNRKFYLTIEGDEDVIFFKVDPKLSTSARMFAAKVNSLSKQASASAAPLAPASESLTLDDFKALLNLQENRPDVDVRSMSNAELRAAIGKS
jgi:hypothetical protein